MRRKLVLTFALGGVTAVAALGFVAGRQVQSPAEAASRRAAPEPSLIAVPVERRTLSTEVITRGTVQFGAAQKVSLATSALKAGAGIVTSAAVAGATLREGDVVMSVSGRPVFVLSGAQPAYRDLGPGSTGKDVLQLESALGRLGFDPGVVDEAYDEWTSAAVERWYVAAGYLPQGPTADQLAARRAADAEGRQLATDALDAEAGLGAAAQAVEAARTKVQLAELALAAAGESESAAVTRLEGHLRSAEAELRAAQLRLGEAKGGRGSPGTAAEFAVLEAELVHAESVVKQAEAELNAARTPGAEASPGARADEEVKVRAVEVARAALAAARARLAERRAGTAAATGAELAALEAALDAAAGLVKTTAAELAAARSAVNGHGASVAAIELGAARVELSGERIKVELATRRLTLARGRVALGEGAASLGVQVPADEVLFFPAFPLRVDETPVRAGEPALGAVMTVTNARLTVVASLPAAEARLVRAGATATISATELGLTAPGSVVEIATVPGTRGADPQRFFLELTPEDAPATLAGASVVVRIVVLSTEGDVLAVPVAALSAAADGRSRVQKRTADGATIEITVTVGLAAEGLVAVRPVDAQLLPGDLVVIPNINRKSK